MKIMIGVMQLAGILTSFISVYYWWRSATLKPVTSPTTQDVPKGDSGDVWFQSEDGVTIHYRYSYQSLLNAYAAAWTGATAGIQLLATTIGFFGPKVC